MGFPHDACANSQGDKADASLRWDANIWAVQGAPISKSQTLVYEWGSNILNEQNGLKEAGQGVPCC